ncbi:single-stranded DNA-binding protein [Novosphingobium sp. JCM 18896]|uniref:single-stranded DNA-binding protein n=1 Tax=Novosphingobium sp. JCM 18896 TaxID=2989731 RepID=UPI002223144D|nr:single-stranded DNA-binding protein [Novosphingobium sp. JCM 18896]MCW1431365.1 single-stranded DNA-binding protein [Novosphingobium sp. JCM 18896]
MQSITIAGRIGRDAELRNTQNGDQVCGFTVAVDTRQGRDKVTNWWRVSLWGKRGEALAQYLTKGASVTVQGEFSLGEYDGKPQLNIRANEIALQGGRSEGGQRDQRSAGDQVRDHFPQAEDLDDSIPF